MRTTRKSRWARLAVGIAASATLEVPLFVGSAQAIVGRPLTPMSYAGVARRTTRRAVAVAPVAHPYYRYW